MALEVPKNFKKTFDPYCQIFATSLKSVLLIKTFAYVSLRYRKQNKNIVLYVGMEHSMYWWSKGHPQALHRRKNEGTISDPKLYQDKNIRLCFLQRFWRSIRNSLILSTRGRRIWCQTHPQEESLCSSYTLESAQPSPLEIWHKMVQNYSNFV